MNGKTVELGADAMAGAEAAALPPDENRLIAERRDKLRALRTQGIAFPNDFRIDAFAGDLQAECVSNGPGGSIDAKVVARINGGVSSSVGCTSPGIEMMCFSRMNPISDSNVP